VLVLDEPANGLDPEGIVWMRRLLGDFAEQGRTVLVSSHVLSEVQQLVDHVVIISRGRLVHQGPLEELAGSTTTVVSVRTPAADELLAALSAANHGGAGLERVGAECLRITGVEPARIGDVALAAGVPVHELTPLRSALEDVFFALTAGPGDRPLSASEEGR
jgi:ABC-2 type transport system ATP-binding protein